MKIYIGKNGEQQGPYSIEEINALARSATITGDDVCWYKGCAEWIPLSQLPGFIPAQPVVGPPPSQIAPVSSVSLPASGIEPTSRPPSTKIPPSKSRYVWGCAALVAAVGVYFLFNGTNSWFGRTMPLTVETYAIYGKKVQEKMYGTDRLRDDMTNKWQPQSGGICGIEASVMSEMGYSYNLTVRKIAQNVAAIMEHPYGMGFLLTASNAFDNRHKALDAGLIDRETLLALEQMPKNLLDKARGVSP